MLSPPADSPYIRALDLDYVDVLEKEIIDFSRQGQIILGGDLNARTGSLPDFITENNDDHLPLFVNMCTLKNDILSNNDSETIK
jgi:hypothetical protein